MMKRICIFILIVAVVQVAMAQNFKGGIRAGFTATQMSGDDLSGFHKMGAVAGGFVNWRFVQNERWAIQPEINFVMKGSSTFLHASKDGYIGQKYVLTLGYVEVPVLVKFNIVKGLELEFGPALDVLLFGQEKDANGKIPARQPFRQFGMTAMAGISYTFAEHYGIDLRYANSIIAVRVPNGDYGQYRIRGKQFSSEILFSVFYQF